MTVYLGYPYSTGSTKKEQIQIDEKIKESRKEFNKGFVKGATLSIAAYSLYSLSMSAVHAKDVVPPPATPPGNGVTAPKPGFKPLSEGAKGTFVGGGSAVCAAAIQSGDFYLGLACACILIVGGIVVNRSNT